MMYRSSRALALAIAAGGFAGGAAAQTATMPPHSTIFTGSTRGYWFTAPADFTMTGIQTLQAPTGTNTFMNWAVVRFQNNTPPPAFALTTNAFDQLALGLNQATGSYFPVNIDIHAGEVIGVYGNTAAASGTTTGVNSYTATGTQATTMIFGNTVNLNRSGMQFHLGSATSPQGMHDIWSEPTSTAISRVEFTYIPINPNAIGACCFNDGSCQFITSANCTAGGGVFRGENVACAAANCPQPGACCRPDGTCTFVLQSACPASVGTWNGGATCATANCPQPGACCRFDGTCFMTQQATCTGIFQGQGVQCGTITCPAPPPVIYSNCTLATGATTLSGVGGLAAGEQWSECARDETDPFTANTTAGFGGTGALRLADDFVVPAGGINLAYVRAYAYLTGATAPGVTAATLRIWNRPPNDPTATVVFGDTTTNRLAANQFAPLYRIFNTVAPVTGCAGTGTAPGTTRHIQYVYIAVNQFLPAGTYWVDLNYTGASFSPPSTQSDAIGRQCDPNNSNALQFNAAWVAMNDAGQGCLPTPVQQDLYFDILGTAGGSTCYANCDASTTIPFLNVNDFICFQGRFASGDSYANCDQSTTMPVLNVNDFICFQGVFAAGCSAP